MRSLVHSQLFQRKDDVNFMSSKQSGFLCCLVGHSSGVNWAKKGYFWIFLALFSWGSTKRNIKNVSPCLLLLKIYDGCQLNV